MQKLSGCRKRPSEIQRRRSTSSSCMIAICPAGPPKLIIPSLSQKRRACASLGLTVVAATAGAPAGASIAASVVIGRSPGGAASGGRTRRGRRRAVR